MKTHQLFLFLLFFVATLSLPAQEIDSLYRVFDHSKGEAAYHAAVAIDETIGREPNFDADTDKDEIKLKVLRTMILYFFNHDDFQHVVTYSEEGIAHYNKIGDLFNLAGCYMTLANAYQRLGQFDKAIDSYNHCSELMDELGGEMAQVNKRYVMNNVAEIHLAMKEYDQAEAMYLKCVEMLGEVQEQDTASNLDRATYSQNLAEVYIAQDRFPEAVALAEQSLDLSRRYQDTPNKIINRMMSLSKAYLATGKPKEGKKLLDDALALAQEEEELFLQAVIHLQKGDYEQAIVMAEANHYDELLQEALETGYQQLKDHDPAKALRYLERSNLMRDAVFNETQQQLIRDYQVRYATQEKEHALAMEQEKTKRNRMYLIVLGIVATLLLLIAFIWYRLAQTRKKRNEELERLNLTKDRLLSIVSHDVKTPVGALCTMLGQMTSSYDRLSETDRKANLIMMHASAEALNSRVSNIMQWVRGELENSAITPVVFNLHDLVDEDVKAQGAAVGVKSLKVVNAVPSELTVHDDPNAVSLVLRNLLSNAVKFSYPNGEVRVKASEEGNRVWVSVEDDGMGIGEKKLEKIFNFMTSSASGTGGETGTGIGLFVSKQLIDKIGGEIRIESKKDAGTTVRFSINKG